MNDEKTIRKTPLYYGHQYIDESDINAVIDVLKNNFLTCGPKIIEMENKLCELTGAKYAVAISNGTAALHAACYATGIGNGDEVITTPITFAASANCVLYCGARPVFADINPLTYNISPKSIEENITDKTKAVIAVDYTGQAVELDEIRVICKKHNLILIEDAAHSLGTKYKDKYIGSIADITTFSFHPVKTITGGEGGAILTNDYDYYKKLCLFRAHGITREADMFTSEALPWYYEQIDLGYNYRITDIQAALIISQLDKLDIFSKRRKEIVDLYNNAFSQIAELTVQQEIPESDTTRHLYILRIKPELLKIDRLGFYNALKDENIICNVHYIPVYYFPYYKKLGYKKNICPIAEKLYEEILTLPLYYGLSDEDIEDVINAVKKVIRKYCL